MSWCWLDLLAAPADDAGAQRARSSPRGRRPDGWPSGCGARSPPILELSRPEYVAEAILGIAPDSLPRHASLPDG
jgi:hypothetical protein